MTKIDSTKSQYVIFDENEYIMIKQGNGTVAIWTENKLTLEEQALFRSNYFSLSNRDSSIKASATFYYISGFTSFNLKGVLGNSWGTYKFTHSNNKIIMTCPSKKISHLNYGNIKVKESGGGTIIIEKPIITCSREVKYFIYQGIGYNYNTSNYRYNEYEINSMQVVQNNMFEYDNHEFVAWSRVGSGKVFGSISVDDIPNYSTSLDYYAPGYEFKLSNSYTFYGIWKEITE